MTPAGWPQRFEVRVRGRSAGEATYRVVTWSGVAAAEALAIGAHRRRHPDDEPLAVEAVEVEPPARSPRGTVALEPDDVVDRLEF